MRCNICNEEKDKTEFQTYWHSSQNVHRTRKQCTKCFNLKKRLAKNPNKFYEKNPDYKKCKLCNQWKEISVGFYTRTNGKVYLSSCKECEKAKDREKRQQQKNESCGCDRVGVKPNTYFDIQQKECTFNMMTLLGYTYDKPTGIWIKPGFKEIKDGKPYFPNIKRTSKRIAPETIMEMFELRKLGWGYQRIGAELNVSDTSVFKHLNKI
jgi:hypothetical protein